MSTPYHERNRQQPSPMAFQRYAPFAPIDLPDRTWPGKVITQAAARRDAQPAHFIGPPQGSSCPETPRYRTTQSIAYFRFGPGLR